MEEEEKNEDEGKELLPRVQRLEDKLKGSKHNMIELIHGNMALQYELNTIREEEGHIRQELASLRETLLPVLSSQVRTMHGELEEPDKPSGVLCMIQAFLPVGAARQASSSHYSVLPHHPSHMQNLFVHVCTYAEYICGMQPCAYMHAVHSVHAHASSCVHEGMHALCKWQLSMTSTHCCQSLHAYISVPVSILALYSCHNNYTHPSLQAPPALWRQPQHMTEVGTGWYNGLMDAL